MEKKPSARQDQMLNQQKEMLIQEISKCSEDISDNQTKISRYNKIIGEKFEEVEKLKADLDTLGKAEQKSKEDVKNILRKVTGLFNGLEVILRNVQQQMVSNVKSNIKKNLQQFKKFLDAAEGMEEVNEVLKQTELLERDFRNGNTETLKIFQKNLHDFEAGIVKIVDLLNPAIKKIQLNLSLKKFDDFWAIYKEINQCLDQIGEWSRIIAKTGAEKIYKVVVLQDMESFGNQKDQDALTQMLNLWQEKTVESENLLESYTKSNNELKLNFNSIETEWKQSRLQYQEKAMLIDVNISNAFKHYSTTQSTLNPITNLLQDAELALSQDAEQKITALMQEFRKKIQSFGNVFGKAQKVADEKKRVQLQAEITKKFDQFVANMQTFFDGMIIEVTATYTQNIEKIIGQLNKVIQNAQKELNLVRTNIDTLQISASKDILLELLDLSQEQVKIHQNLVDSTENEMMHLTFISNATKKVQELQKNIDRMFGIHQAKLTITQKTNSLSNGYPISQWEIRNAGRIAFADFKTAMVIPKGLTVGKIQPNPGSSVKSDLGQLSVWNIPKLDRQESQAYSFEVQQITPDAALIENFRMNDIIGSYNTSMYRKSGNVALLKIRESNGIGEVELSNPSKKNAIWNVTLQFQPTEFISDLPTFTIPLLKPGEKKVISYHYTKPQKLIPDLFHGEISVKVDVSFTKNKEKAHTYGCEVVVENTSDFLIYLTQFSIYSLDSMSNSILTLDHLNDAPLEPGFSYAKTEDIQCADNPPKVTFYLSHSVQLLHEYVMEQPTVSSLAQGKSKADESTLKAIQLIEENIAQLNEQKESLEAILVSIQAQIMEKDAEKQNLLQSSAKTPSNTNKSNPTLPTKKSKK